MDNRTEILTLHWVAKTYGQRPSTIVGIADEWAAYQFDVAVLVESLDDKPGKQRTPVGAGNWDTLAKL